MSWLKALQAPQLDKLRCRPSSKSCSTGHRILACSQRRTPSGASCMPWLQQLSVRHQRCAQATAVCPAQLVVHGQLDACGRPCHYSFCPPLGKQHEMSQMGIDQSSVSSMLCLNAQGCKIFVTDIRGCLESMQLPCFNSCGKMIFVVLRCLSRTAWEYTMALTLMGVRHLISPRWLEKM